MKKFIFSAFALMTTLFTLTSCDDQRIANTLEGTWSGNMYISSRYDGRVYDATYSEVTFLKDPYAYSSGKGYWVDYYSDAPWDYIANHIDWTVDFGTITVHFKEERSTIKIRDYHLDNYYFYGTINDNGRPVDFQLERVSGRNWSSYRWGYDSWYVGTRSAESADTTKIEKPVRFVREK
jgi:hypothetical protein